MNVYLIQESHGCCDSIDLYNKVFLDIKEAVKYCFDEDVFNSGGGEILKIDTETKSLNDLDKFKVLRENKWYDLAKKYGVYMK